MAEHAAGTLYLVSTPIGNLEDITRRALRVLAEVDLIACEDTRHTRRLLDAYSIRTKMISYHEHNERERAVELALRLATGESIALVSDAGTPAVSDPGYRLVRAAIECGAPVVPVPGASAFVAALTASGLPTDEFFFGGFLPARSSARRARLTSLRALPCTLVFYEAPHRISETLRDAREILGEREAAVARELTKLHEEIARGRLSELAEKLSGDHAARGEMVVVIDRNVIEGETVGKTTPARVSIAALVAAYERDEGLDQRAALKRVARRLGLTRDEAYRRLVAERAQAVREESSTIDLSRRRTMSKEEEERTFNDEQRAMFEQPDDAPTKARPRTPGESDAQQHNSENEAGADSGKSQT